MLPGQTEVRPENIVASQGLNVNGLFQCCVSLSDGFCASLFEKLIRLAQQEWLERDLGPPRSGGVRRTNLLCPRCRHRGFIRRGWRKRKIRTSRGTFEFRLAQISCRQCRRVFRPYGFRLGLPSTRRFLAEVEEKMIHLATQLPYGRAQDILFRLNGMQVSPNTIRQRILQEAEEEKAQPVPQRVSHCLTDATKVQAGAKPRGEQVHMAVSVERGPLLNGRATLKKNLLGLSLGGAEEFKGILHRLHPQRLVHDGLLDVSDCADKVQRCRWHLPREMRIFLHWDGLRWRNSAPVAAELREILWRKGPLAYDRFALELRNQGLRRSARHLEKARKEIFTHREDPGFQFTTTSPLEREMRELNRRMDVGARWSPQGAENMLWVLFKRRFKYRSQILKEHGLSPPS